MKFVRAVGRLLADHRTLWSAGVAVVAWGFYQTDRIQQDQCDHAQRQQETTEDSLRTLITVLGSESDADPELVDRVMRRAVIEPFAELPDPC